MFCDVNTYINNQQKDPLSKIVLIIVYSYKYEDNNGKFKVFVKTKKAETFYAFFFTYLVKVR